MVVATGIVVDDFVLWYDERRPGLGDEFIAEVSVALNRIANAPASCPAWPGTQARGALIQGHHPTVPYVIAFEKHEQHVLAVAHAKRRPLYWLKRVNP